ncbi:unnamed protein product [Rhizoctonia solani]|uniref:AB hydrolase-1 domain-containing protein n=1 Tax=Rhizoctonia solani TaxID=456999 RepID=A0A8H3I151_9AGAM|nr:unnamed protein product [Rhizoctonia solani]
MQTTRRLLSAMHYPPPNTPTPRGTTVPRTLTPLAKANESSAPQLATSNRTLVPGWTCSTHVFRAATPRESPPPGPTAKAVTPAEMTKTERSALAEAKFNEIAQLRKDISFGSKTFPVNDATMWTVANRYAPDKPRVGNHSVTVVLSHATGFHKEIWETTLRFLLSTPQGQANIDEIWALDAANHGDSGLLNKEHLGEIFEWSDHTRDILNFLTKYLPDKAEKQVEPGLAEIPEQTTQQRLERGFAHRTIIGIGHSFGGCTLARAAIESPRIFSSIMLLDPVIYPSYAVRGPGIDALTKGALIRRDHWPNR